MSENSLYDAIFRRRSVRKYEMTGSDPRIMEIIRQEIGGLEPLYPEIRIELHILNAGETRGGFFAVTAPYYIAAYSQPGEGYLMNMGYLMQQLDLALSNRGIGCCWLGMAKPNRDVSNGQNMEFIIVLATGVPAEPVHRSMVSEFKRKPLEQVTNIKGYQEDQELFAILEAARLAPSATNSQPWYFSGTGDAIKVLRQTLNPVKAMVYDRMNQIDIGIALCHIRTAAVRFGKKAEFVKENETGSDVKNYRYCITVRLT